MAGEKAPTYGLQYHDVKSEAPNDEEEQVPTQIMYRCPHKRGEGGRCNDKNVDFNLLLNHFYKHHARERILKKSNPKFAMCCFRQNCPSKFQSHMELVEHMWEHDNDPAENIYFTEYIKKLFEKENEDLGLDNKELLRSVKELKEEVNDLKADRNMLQADNSKIKETNELMIKNKDLELELKVKDLRKQEVELKKLKEDKDHYKNKYHSEKKRNAEFKAEIDGNGITVEKQKETILDHKEKITGMTIKLNLKDAKIKELETIIANNPSSSSTNINENSMKREAEKKDKIIKDMKRNEKILKKQILKLNKEKLNSMLKKSCSSSDSDESSGSASDDTKDEKKSDKRGKRKDRTQSSSDESSETEKRNSRKKKRNSKHCTQSPEISTGNQEYTEES